MYSLDATTIDLCLSAFPWAEFRSTKGAIKLHVGLNHEGYLPEFVTVTEGKTHDIAAAKTMDLASGSIIVVDKGYNDYAWYNQLTDKGIFFVTHLKTNAKYRVIERLDTFKSKGITSDQIIEFTRAQASKKSLTAYAALAIETKKQANTMCS